MADLNELVNVLATRGKDVKHEVRLLNPSVVLV